MYEKVQAKALQVVASGKDFWLLLVVIVKNIPTTTLLDSEWYNLTYDQFLEHYQIKT